MARAAQQESGGEGGRMATTGTITGMSTGQWVRDIARWTDAFSPRSLPAEAVTQAKHLILDTIGCAVAALAEDEALAVPAAVEAMGGAPQASLIGRGARSSAAGAALANGALLRFLDLNDFLMDGGTKGASVGGHPSDNIGPVLAVAEWRDASGLDAIGAVALCYEIYARLNGQMDRTGGWDTTSVSAFSVATAAGKLMGLDPARLANAIALGAIRAPTPGVVRSGHISAAKYLANAMVAHAAVEAAVLAEHGLTGPMEAVEHARGLGKLFDLTHDPDVLCRPLGQPCALMMSSIKAYPCLATGQTVAAAGARLHEQIGGKAGGRIDGIRSITVTMADSPVIRRQQTDPGRLDPRSREAADHSFPFIAAIALIEGRLTPRDYDGERWNAPDVRALMGRMRFDTDAALGARNPDGYPVRIRLDMADGTSVEAESLAAPGMSAGGIAREAVVAKFEALTEGLLSTARRDAVCDMVLRLDTLPSVRPLMEALALPPGT
jgi:2-methylcitrate dehydratase